MRKILILFLILPAVMISGCTQQEIVTKENFTEGHFKFLSIDYSVGLDTSLWQTKQDWARDICRMCHVGMIVHPVLGEQKCPNYPNETCNCLIAIKAEFNLTVPKGWNNVSCGFSLNEKNLTEKYYNTTGIKDYVADPSYGSRIDENNTIEICCEDVCDRKTLVTVC
jgi:hypothetical protein